MTAATLLGEGIAASGTVADALRPYRTQDGYVALLAISWEEFEGLTRALGRPELTADARFATLADVYDNFVELIDIVVPIVRRLTTSELLERLGAEDVPCAPIVDVARVHEDPQVQANGLLAEVEHPHAGWMRTPLAASMFGSGRPPIRRHAPMLGQHTDEILADIGEDADSVTRLREAKTVA
jgi:crotonobetainyl-CoA:carnitine CoA-transferase CaiB-like acyl-CoA transferase